MNQMTRQEILDAILPLNDPQNAARRLQWLIDLGYQYAVAAGVAGDFGWAVHTSIRSLTKQ
jgi:hypothetical protein